MSNLVKANWRWVVLGLSMCVIVWRAPGLFTEPRLWAEEGTRYFRSAYAFAESPQWYRSLFQVQRGYFALWPNIAATAAANLVPLEEAPRVTTALALLIQLAAVAILLWSESELWSHRGIKTLGVLAMIFAPLSGEIWLNTINSQFVLALIGFLILHANARQSQRLRWLFHALLGIAGLTGVVSILLTPLFVFKALKEKSRERAIQAGILSACSLIQAAIMMLFASDTRSTIFIRWTGMDWTLIVSVLWTQSIGLLLFGLENARGFFSLITALRATNPQAYQIGCLLLGVIEIACLWAISLPLDSLNRLTLLGSYLTLILVSTAGALPADRLALVNPGVAERYFYAPNAILALTAVGSLQRFQARKFASGQRRWMLIPGAVFLAASLLWGMKQFQPTTQAGADWPSWREQVRIWRKQPDHELEIWPPGWKTQLTKKNK